MISYIRLLVVTIMTIYIIYYIGSPLAMYLFISFFVITLYAMSQHHDNEIKYYTLLVLFIGMFTAHNEYTSPTNKLIGYSVYDVYEYNSDGSEIYVRYMRKDTFRKFTSTEQRFEPMYMKLNDCIPVLKQVWSGHWYTNDRYSSSIYCFKDMTDILKDNHNLVKYYSLDENVSSYFNSDSSVRE